MDLHPNFYLGTSGWSYPWQGIFYPPGLRPADYLPFYAQRFNCTEINSSFYHYTMLKTIEKWLDTTPESFRFAPKLNREITHERKFVSVDSAVDRFMSRFQIMGSRLGPILVQIAASFSFQPEPATRFFESLRDNYPDQTFVLEARHRSWFTDDALELLRNCRIGWVIADSGGRFPQLEILTSDTVYLRLHGEKKLYDSNYSDESLEKYAFLIRKTLKEGKEVWLFFNNTMHGQAITDAAKLSALLGEMLSLPAV